MNCQNPFAGKDKKNIVNLLSAELAQRLGYIKKKYIFLHQWLLFVHTSAFAWIVKPGLLYGADVGTYEKLFWLPMLSGATGISIDFCMAVLILMQ